MSSRACFKSLHLIVVLSLLTNAIPVAAQAAPSQNDPVKAPPAPTQGPALPQGAAPEPATAEEPSSPGDEELPLLHTVFLPFGAGARRRATGRGTDRGSCHAVSGGHRA